MTTLELLLALAFAFIIVVQMWLTARSVWAFHLFHTAVERANETTGQALDALARCDATERELREAIEEIEFRLSIKAR